MYLPRAQIAQLYTNLQRTLHAQSPPVLLLVALEPDALCACRILTALFKRDYIPHNIVPVAGYADLARAGESRVRPMRRQGGGEGGVVVCLGVGGLVDLGAVLALEPTEEELQNQTENEEEDPTGGVEVWVVDARRPWNLGNVFGGGGGGTGAPADSDTEADTSTRAGRPNGNGNGRTKKPAPEVTFGEIQPHYRPGKGGIIVLDEGDIAEELEAEREAYFKLEQLPEIDDDGVESDDSESDSDDEAPSGNPVTGQKRKSWTDDEDEDGDEEGPPRQRRRSNSSSSLPASPSRPARHGLVSLSHDYVPNSHPDQRPTSPLSSSALPPSHQERPLSIRRKRRRLLRLKRKHEATLHAYYSLGTSYSEPIASLVYNLASELGREDNDALWHAIVGVSSLELYGRSMAGVGVHGTSAAEQRSAANVHGWGGDRGERIRQSLRDEVRRLNPPDPSDARAGEAMRGATSGVIPTTAKGPQDYSIRLSPEPRFLLIRHWSLYDSMLHSPYLAARLHLWSDVGRKRLHKFLAKMGMSLAQCKQSYTHMDMALKRNLRHQLLKYAPEYNLEGLVPPPAVNGRGREGWGFVRSWGWNACLSAVDVAVIVGAILEVGKDIHISTSNQGMKTERVELVDEEGRLEGEEYVGRFWAAYDALENVSALTAALGSTQHLHQAILRTGTSILSKHQIRHLKAFRIAVIKEGPDVQLFTHPGALTKLALWIGEALAEQERDKVAAGRTTPLVLAGLNERRGVYVVVGTGGGGGGGAFDVVARMEREERKREAAKRKEEKDRERERKKLARAETKRLKAAARRQKEQSGSDDEGGGDAGDREDEEEDDTEEDDDSDDDDSDDDEQNGATTAQSLGRGRNRFGIAFQEVIDETNAKTRVDSFEHCVVEVKKEDLGAFLEALSFKAVLG